jgi:uncharacterized repeat protein (TIGR03803 family)
MTRLCELRRLNSLKFLPWLAVLVLTAALPICAYAAGPKLQVLHSFTAGPDGLEPLAANLVADATGTLYGTTPNGGTDCFVGGQAGCGVVFKLSPPNFPGGVWKETILYRFNGGADGATPYAGLVLDSQGNLYGTTQNGGNFNGICAGQVDYGCGVVFELSPNSDGSWTETTIYAFTGQNGDGANPAANLVLDGSGNLYGTTELGGACPSNCGSLQGAGIVFELTPNGSQGWTETILYQFTDGADGGYPITGLIFDQQGNLYGTTVTGGMNHYGTVYQLTPPMVPGLQWTESILYAFSSAAGEPRGGVIFDNSGNLYGTTSFPYGTAFELSPAGNGVWTESTLYTFGQSRLNMPWAGLVSDNAGNLYGTASSGKFCGGVFRLQKHKGTWTEGEFGFFTGNNGPCGPLASLIFGKWGAVYGTSATGGKCSLHQGCGTVFAIFP